MSNDFFNPLLMAIQTLGMQSDPAQRAQQISHCEQSLQLLSTWLSLMLSLLKHYNKGNFAEGLKYFSGQQGYSVVLRSTLMLAANQRVVRAANGTQKNAT